MTLCSFRRRSRQTGFWLIAAFILAAALLSACAPSPLLVSGSADATAVSPTTAPTFMPANVVRTSTIASTRPPTLSPMPTASPSPAQTWTVTETRRPEPTTTSAPTATSTPSATPTPAGPELVVLRAANLRAGPRTEYPVIGGAQAGAAFSVLARNPEGTWWQVALAPGRSGWIWGGLVEANAATQRAPVAQDIPAPPPTATPAPPTAIPTLVSPPIAEVVVLGPDTVYPVRAHRFVGAGYELVDASSQYDLVLHRDVYGAVARQFWGDRLYGKHPRGIHITLIDPEAPPECAIVCKSCPGQPTIARHLAPIRLSNDWRGDCHARSLSASYGDGQGATIWVGCAYDSGDALGIQTDPEECYVAIAAPGPYLTDLLVSATITTFNWLVVQNYYAMTPDFSQGPFTPHLGRAHKEGDQWRWEDPFVEVWLAGS